MRVGLFLGHPAHFHMLKNLAKALNKNGHDVYFVIKKKDILENLLTDAGYTYTMIREDRSNGLLGLVRSVLGMEMSMCSFLRKNKIDILVGSTLAFASRVIMRTPTIVMGEDDWNIVPKFAKMVFPFASSILSPFVCNIGKWSYKKIGYAGYQKLSYLHPNYFVPDKKIVEQYFPVDESPYYIIRFAKLTAHHDVGVEGFTQEVAKKVIDKLKVHGRVYITSEAPLAKELEQYRLCINPLDIHHILAFASLYIGDSQSMAVEACMLGTPCVRFNDFVGKKKISVLEELESVYHLTNGIHSKDVEKLYQKVDEILAMDNAKDVYQERRMKMLQDKIDVTKFWTWFLENYPNSSVQHDENNEFWQQFK